LKSLSLNQDQLKSGRIASEARQMIISKNILGNTILEICEMVEKKVEQLGGEHAFPCNVSLNEAAAHYTAGLGEEGAIKESDLVKIDFGVHVNGYIADTAVTKSYNSEYESLIQATEESLNNAIGAVRNEVNAGMIGKTIFETAERWGFRPISNLTGHSIEQFQLHAGVSIPNVWIPGTQRLKTGSLYAIEPFLTMKDGAGEVVEGGEPRIYGLISRRMTGKKQLDCLIDHVWKTRKTLPFTPRWYLDIFNKNEIKEIIKDLIRMKIIKGYPVLVERKGRIVAQFEHTVMATDTGAVVITR